ncbi:MAG: hypothetical protein WA421_09315, partial [Nitrososphaeraceae archaeon]
PMTRNLVTLRVHLKSYIAFQMKNAHNCKKKERQQTIFLNEWSLNLHIAVELNWSTSIETGFT